MSKKETLKGARFEELLRAYFLRSGFFVMRGIPLRINADDLTDIDIWLYDRPTGSSRRIQIIDAKFKGSPKAIERIFWTKGVADYLGLEKAYVATTDKRKILRTIGDSLGISILDGSDLKRIQERGEIEYPNRITEEEFQKLIRDVNVSWRSKELSNKYDFLKSLLVDRFGSRTLNSALEIFKFLSNRYQSSYPMSSIAKTLLRCIYLTASIIAISLDFCLSKIPFRSGEEKRDIMINIIRYGYEDKNVGLEKVRLASALIEKYAPQGNAMSNAIMNAISRDFDLIPAEIIVDYTLKHLKNDALYSIAKEFEMLSFSKEVSPFDDLSSSEKSFLSILLDFNNINRSSFAKVITSNNELAFF